MFFYDIETLDIESTAVVLSLGCIYVDPEKEYTYEELLDAGIFIKFDMQEQLKAGRTTDPDTLKWWDRQAEIVKQNSLYPDAHKDLSVGVGMNAFNKWLVQFPYQDASIFVRGNLDQLATESLCRTFDMKPLIPYHNYYDVRSVLDTMYSNSKRGYMPVDPAKCKGFDVSKVLKHHPVHDCAYDAAMILYGQTE